MHSSFLLAGLLSTLAATTLAVDPRITSRSSGADFLKIARDIDEDTPVIKRSSNHVGSSHDAPIKKLVRKKKRGLCTPSSAHSSAATSTSSSVVAVSPPSTASSAGVSSSSAVAANLVVGAVQSASISSSSKVVLSTSSTSSTPSMATSSTTSSSASSSASNAPLISGTGSKLFQLFPTGYGKADWTTCTDSIQALSFTGALKPLTAGTLPKTSNAPDGTSALVANFPAGTVQYSSSTGAGFSFYTEGGHNNVVVEGAKEVIFSYSAYFPDGFQFVKGGKMPGIYGGASLAQAKSCSGGRQNDRDSCFSARMMWRTNGAGEFYNYYPTSINQAGGYCTTAPYSLCDTVYGDSIGRGSFSWATGQWTTVAQRFKLNDPGQANGEQQLFVNGVSVLNLSGLQVATSSDTKIYGIMAQTFFGGNDATWASPVDQQVYFKDWSFAVLA